MGSNKKGARLCTVLLSPWLHSAPETAVNLASFRTSTIFVFLNTHAVTVWAKSSGWPVNPGNVCFWVRVQTEFVAYGAFCGVVHLRRSCPSFFPVCPKLPPFLGTLCCCCMRWTPKHGWNCIFWAPTHEGRPSVSEWEPCSHAWRWRIVRFLEKSLHISYISTVTWAPTASWLKF